jgi:hypothetical protein
VTYQATTNTKHPARRKRHDRVLAVRVQDALYEQLHADADEANVTLAEIIRQKLEAVTPLAAQDAA